MTQILAATRPADADQRRPRLGSGARGAVPRVPQGEPTLGPHRAAQLSGGELRGRDLAPEPRPHERIHRDRRAAAHHAGRQPQRGARERAPVRRDEAPRRRARDRERRPGSLAAQLDPQAMYELVGERASDVFDTQVVDITVFDHETGVMRSRSPSSGACGSPPRPRPIMGVRRSTSSRPEANRLINEDCATARPRGGPAGPDQGGAAAVGDLRAAAGGRGDPGRHLAPEPGPRARVRATATSPC